MTLLTLASCHLDRYYCKIYHNHQNKIESCKKLLVFSTEMLS